MSAPIVRSRKFGKKQQNEQTLHYRNRKERKINGKQEEDQET